MTPTAIVSYLALFSVLGFLFIFVNLLIGRLLRPNLPNAEKQAIYECGEPTIGSSFVQFDLRFYVVALLFLIFDVEVALFFPWAVVFGKTNHLADPAVAQADPGAVSALQSELGVPLAAQSDAPEALQAAASTLARLSVIDILAFFAILMVGFFYVWKRGDLDWVRAVAKERGAVPRRAQTTLPDSAGKGVGKDAALAS